MAYSWPGFLDHVQYVHVGRDGRVKRTVDVPVPGMVMMHDMSLTSNYVVIYDLPVTISPAMLQRRHALSLCVECRVCTAGRAAATRAAAARM